MGGGCRVYVGNLNHRVNVRDLEKFFRKFRRLRDVVLKDGFGFVEFEDDREASDAVYEMNGRELLGARVTVQKAKSTPQFMNRSGPGGGGGGRRGDGRGSSRSFQLRKMYGAPSRTEYRVSVLNLSSKVSWQDLKDFMRQAGDVTYADAHQNGRNRGVIDFRTYNDLRNAVIKLNGKRLHGRKIEMIDEYRRARRSRSRSWTRSRSRGRSRSRSRSRSRGRSRSRSRSSSRSRSRSGSRSRSRSRSKKQRSRSRSRSHSKGSKSRSRSNPSRSRSRSRSRGKGKQKRSISRSSKDLKSRSRSRTRSISKSRTRIRRSRSRSMSDRRYSESELSGSKFAKSVSRSKSRSRSKSKSRSKSNSPINNVRNKSFNSEDYLS